MKKVISILVALTFLFASFTGVYADSGKNKNKKSSINYSQTIKELTDQLKEQYKNLEKREEVLKKLAELKKKSGDKNITILVDGKEVKLDSLPVIKDKVSRMLIPVAPIVKALGASIKVDPKTKAVTIKKDDTTIILKPGSNMALVNGVSVKLDDYVKMNGNGMVVPISFISKILKNRIEIDEGSGTVIIEKDITITLNDNTAGSGNNQFEYSGGWSYGTQAGAYMSDNHWSNVPGMYYQVRFNGTQIKLYGAKAPAHGIALVSIDGGTPVIVDFYAAQRQDNTLVYSSKDLNDGQHILRVVATGEKNAKSAGGFITADRVDVKTKNSSTPVTPPAGVINKYEAESAVLAGGAVKSTERVNYSGTGYVTNTVAGASVTYSVYVAQAGTYKVDLRFANGNDTSRIISIYANSIKVKQSQLARTASWETWADQVEYVNLNSGNNTITYFVDTADTGNVNLDYIVLEVSVGQLSGSIAGAPSSVNLSSEGTLDWIHWGYNGAASITRKAAVTQQISNFTAVSGTPSMLATPDVKFAWIDGTPVASVTGAYSSVYLSGKDNGFTLTVPADTVKKTLRLYVGAWDAKVKIEAVLSDGSTPKFEKEYDVTSGIAYKVISLDYKAASSGQTLTVKYSVTDVHTTNFSNIILQAATLK